MEDLGKQPQIFTWFRRSASAINTTINWRATTHFDSEVDYHTRQSLSTAVLLRTTFTQTIILNLLMKWIMELHLSQFYEKW